MTDLLGGGGERQMFIRTDPNGSGTVDGGPGSVPTDAPEFESTLQWNTKDSPSDWLGWITGEGAGPQPNRGIVKFGAEGVCAPSGALRFCTPIASRSTLLASRNPLTGGFQSILSIASGDDGATQRVEVCRSGFDQFTMPAATIVPGLPTYDPEEGITLYVDPGTGNLNAVDSDGTISQLVPGGGGVIVAGEAPNSAQGLGGEATGLGFLALGEGAVSDYSAGIAIGPLCATHSLGVAIGSDCQVGPASPGVAIGEDVQVGDDTHPAPNGVCIGYASDVKALGGVAIGEAQHIAVGAEYARVGGVSISAYFPGEDAFSSGALAGVVDADRKLHMVAQVAGAPGLMKTRTVSTAGGARKELDLAPLAYYVTPIIVEIQGETGSNVKTAYECRRLLVSIAPSSLTILKQDTIDAPTGFTLADAGWSLVFSTSGTILRMTVNPGADTVNFGARVRMGGVSGF